MRTSRRDLACAVFAGLGCLALATVELRNLYLRHQTDEALDNLDIVLMATTNYAAQAQARGDVYLCPHFPGQSRGAAGPTPPLDVDCSAGRGGSCRPDGSGRPGSYSPALFDDNPIWRALDYRKSRAHRFHFSYSSEQRGKTCTFTVMARADLDGDGVFSTFLRHGVADAKGVRPVGAVLQQDPYE